MRHQRKYCIFEGYGLTLEEYDNILYGQGNRCAICGKVPSERFLAVDHNHKTGVVRGLLCRRCNVGLGYFEDSPNLLLNAIQYLMPDFLDL